MWDNVILTTDSNIQSHTKLEKPGVGFNLFSTEYLK